jgi:hypothetical protein
MPKQRRLTAVCAVRISAEADQLRAELQAITGLPANRLVENAFEALWDRLNQRKTAHAAEVVS